MTVDFIYGDIERYGVRKAYHVKHVRTVVFDCNYMTLVRYGGLIERYRYVDVTNLLIDRKDSVK